MWIDGVALQFKHNDYGTEWQDLRNDDEGFSIVYFEQAEWRVKQETMLVEVPTPRSIDKCREIPVIRFVYDNNDVANNVYTTLVKKLKELK